LKDLSHPGNLQGNRPSGASSCCCKEAFSFCGITLSITALSDELFSKTNASTTLADRSCKCFCLSDFYNSFMFGGKLYFVGNDSLLFIAAVITLDLNTIIRKSLFGQYDDETSVVTL
jgi:hypothetical protein